MKDFIILTDSSCDLSSEMIKALNLNYIGLVCNLNGKEIIEDYSQNFNYKEFYDLIRDGAMPTTSQINSFRFYTEFERHVKDNKAIIYIAFSSGLSGTYSSSIIARNEILEAYPNADISIIDTKAASTGVGLLAYYAAQMKKQGKTKPEIVQWLEDNRLNTCHFFTVNDLNHLKRGGRVSPAAAAIGNLLNLKPVLYVDDDGHLKNFAKAKGSKKALATLLEKFEDHVVNPEEQYIFISHSDNLKGAEDLASMIRSKYNVKNVFISYIGPVIGSHTGPGTVTLFFLGNKREP